MAQLPVELIIVALGFVATLGLFAWRSKPAPYNIFAESWRQAIELVRRRPKLAIFALLLFLGQLAAPLLIARYAPKHSWVAAGVLVGVQALLIYVLAHVAYRLHRGLIYGDWKQGLNFGTRERRMALYVVAGWFVVAVLARLPVPTAPFIHPILTSAIGAGLSLLAFVVKVFLSLMGPAASLDDPTPLRRSLTSVAREPVAAFAIFTMIYLSVFLLNQLFNLIAIRMPTLAGLSAALALSATTFFFILAEFALVILLTRVSEDQYEPETRYAAHNLNWF